jgi:hypothetical protein
MIFNQVQEIISGQKTQTRRLVKPGEYTWICGRFEDGSPAYSSVHHESHRVRFERGKTYAVQQKRGKPALWIRPDGSLFTGVGADTINEFLTLANNQPTSIRDIPKVLRAHGYTPLRIQITAIRRERIQDISEEDAKAEGLIFEPCCGWCASTLRLYKPNPISAYALLWDSINRTKGTRWADNPAVWVLTFKVVTP